MPVLNTANAVRLGAQQANAVYLGANKVWSPPASVWTPASLPGLGLWLSARNITAAEGANVTAWTDASPGHHNATLVGANAPTYNTALGGVPAVSFTGLDHRMQVAGFGTALSGKTAYTLFVRMQSFDNSNYPIMLTAPTSAQWDFINEHNSDSGIFWGHGNARYRCSVPLSNPLSTWHTYSFVFAATPHLYVDGSEPAIGFLGPSGDMQSTVPALGANVVLGAYYNGQFGWNGLISDVIWYDHALTNSERALVEAWLVSAPPPFSPANITGLRVWLDASQLTGADGAAVSPWPNLAAGGPPGTMAMSPPPKISTTKVKGQRVVRFTSNEGGMRMTSLGVRQDYTIVYIGRVMASGVIGRVVTTDYPGDDGSNNWLVGFHPVGYDWFYDNTNVSAAVTWDANGYLWKLYSVDSTPTQQRILVNGVVYGDRTGGATGIAGRLNISGYQLTSTETCDCEVAELLLYDRKLSDADRKSVEDYLRAKWL
jgi:Concanavalin A-like lectin/glucanases superfamily